MLLESALANFSTHESDLHSGARGWDWKPGASTSSKPNSAPDDKKKKKAFGGGGGVSNSAAAAVAAAEIKHVYRDGKLPSGRLSVSVLGKSPQKEMPMVDFLGMSSRSPPPPASVDEISREDDNLSGGAHHPAGKLKSPYRSQSGRSINANSVADSDSIGHDRMPFGRDAKLKLQQQQKRKATAAASSAAVANNHAASNATTAQRAVMQPPPNRVISMFNKNGKGVSPSRSAPSPQRKDYSRGSSSPTPKGISPIRQASKVARRNFHATPPSAEAKQLVKRTEPFKPPTPPPPPPTATTVVHIDNNSSSGGTMTVTNSEPKFYEEEESPVSILQRPLPSPPTTNSSATSSGSSSAHSPPRVTAALLPPPPPPPAQALPGVTVRQHRRHIPSFSSSSALEDSPRASTSSSNRYMGQCLVALQAALAIDPEKSKRFEDSFVELDTYVVEGEQQTANFPKSPISVRSEGQGESLEWAARDGRNAELEPEYNAMDFYSSSEHEDDEPRSRTASLTRSSSGTSSSRISRPIRRALSYQPQVSVDLYSSRDRRLLSSHPSSWVEHGGDDSVSSSNSNTLTRHHHYVPWDEQQADLDAVRAEEVVRGAIDGLRFTYSPVSSAFVFTRSTREGREGELEEDHDGRRAGYVSYRSPRYSRTFTDSEASRSFSGDYEAASVYSEDSMSFARGSDVTELEVSRAESWSKVARAIAFQQGYQDAVPSSFIRRSSSNNKRGCSRRSSNKPQSSVFQPVPAPGGRAVDRGTPDSRLVRKSKKSTMTTCLPFRSILRNTFRTVSAPGRSRLGMTPNSGERQIQWSNSAPVPGGVSRLTY